MFWFVNVKFMIVKSAIVVSLLSTILLVNPVLAENTAVPNAAGTIKKNRINPPIQKLENRLASKEAALAQKMEEIRAKIASKEAILKTRLQKFRDKRKAEIAERINTNLNRINKNRTEDMLRHLNKMSTILDKLEARVNQGKPDIKDSAKAKEAIDSARDAIASASAAAQAQAAKDYTLTVSSEAAIRAEAKAARDKLHTDLQAVRKLSIAAKQAVGNAIRVAKSGKLEIPGQEGTASGEQ